MILSLMVSSTVGVLIGFRCAARAPSMNKLMINLLWTTMILYIPLLSFFKLVPEWATWILAIIPSYAIMLSLLAGVAPGSLTQAQWIYTIGYLGIRVIIGWFVATKEYRASIISEGR